VKIGDKVRAVRDFWVEPCFDGGWEVKEGMLGVVYAVDLGAKRLRVDFGEALDSRKRKKGVRGLSSHKMQLSWFYSYATPVR
jgi:hypothetical protein